MKLLNKAIQIILVLIVANFASDLIVSREYTKLTAIMLGFLFLFSSLKYKYYLFSASVFYPFYFNSRFVVISNPEWIMIVAPLLCLLLIADIIMNKRSFYSRESAIFFAAAGVLVLWAIINYMKNPVLGQQFSGATSEEGGLKSYFLIVVGLTIFLSGYWYFRYHKFNVNSWLNFLIGLSLFLGILRIFSYFFNFQIPLLGGRFKYLSLEQFERVGNVSYRIGGLKETAITGLSLVMGSFYKKRTNGYLIALVTVFLLMLILAGGRAAFFGMLLALLVYIILINRKYLLPSIFFISMLMGIFLLASPDTKFSETKFGRVTGVSEEHIKQQVGRIESAKAFIQVYLDNPVFGKGIGHDTSKIDIATLDLGHQKTAAANVFQGGHGSYLSILALFGIGGVFFLIVMLFGTMLSAYKMFKRHMQYGDDNAKIAIFALLYLITLSVTFIVEQSGYDNMQLWFFAGMIAGTLDKEGDDKCRIIVNR